MSYRGYSSREEWERNKWYLVRQLFDDPPLLSPIQEEQEPLESLDSLDSLPELIIEVVPRRPNHDETKEFYKNLEREVRDFLNLSREDYHSSPYEDLESSRLLEERDTSSTFKIQHINVEELKSASFISKSSSDSRRSSSLVPRDLANKDGASDSIRSPPTMNSEGRLSTYEASEETRSSDASLDSENFGLTGKIDTSSTKMQDSDNIMLEEDIRRHRSWSRRPSDLGEKEDPFEVIVDASLQTPEAMRKGHYKSYASELYEYTCQDSSTSDRPSSLSLEESEITTRSPMSEEKLEPLQSSTPIHSSAGKRKLTSSSSFITKKNKLIQTSFSDTSEKEIWKNFFVGKPIVYKICTGTDHACM